jgi:uncharacterized protein (DUF362 family)
MRPTTAPKVILRHAESYDAAAIRVLVREGMAEMGLVPRGRTLVKPNLVAAGPLFEHAHTRPEFIEGVLLALRDRDAGAMTELGVGERCGITIPSRYVFRAAGVDPVIERCNAVRHLFDEVRQVEIPLTHPGRLRDSLFVPEPVARADFFVNCPKFKSHPWTTVTFSLKNYIGIQDDRHRMIDHDHALNRKVLDLQYVTQPELVAIDCIIAGEARMLTPIPRTMQLVILGNNQVAVDAVCCRMIGIDPLEVEHIRLAHEAGFGPVDAASIAVTGDVSVDAARERARGFRVGLVRVEKYFEGSHISAYAGPPPGHTEGGYCWGGCPGALEEAMDVLRLFDPMCDGKMPKIHVVLGAYSGPLDIGYGEKVLFVGDCVSFEGQIGGQVVQIGSKYRERSEIDPNQARHQDMYAKMLRVARQLQKAKHEPFIRLDGCPVSVAELIMVLCELGGIKSPYFEPRIALSFNRAYLAWQAVRAAGFLSGEPYQVQGFRERGEAAPDLSELDEPVEG